MGCDSVALADITLVMNDTEMVKIRVPLGQEAYPETQSKELGLDALLLEGTHALHGVGHHGHSSWPHLPAASGIYQPWVPTDPSKPLLSTSPHPHCIILLMTKGYRIHCFLVTCTGNCSLQETRAWASWQRPSCNLQVCSPQAFASVSCDHS